MKERPILFSGPMIRALLAGTKTQTRRLVKGDKPGQPLDWLNAGFDPVFVASPENGLCPYGAPGDTLWVRETWAPWDGDPVAIYRADNDGREPYDGWTPSIHMFRWASRLTLTITDVRVERLNDISETDAIAEGIGRDAGLGAWHGASGAGVGGATRLYASPVRAYADLWEHINGPESWAANPWVWAVSFTVEPNPQGAAIDGEGRS